MSDLTKKYQEIMKDIENNISDEKELEYINKKIAEISMLHMEVIENMTGILKNKLELIEDKISKIEQIQSSMDIKINKIENSVLGIENDMYDDGFDFEIICPYCNAEFTADVQSKKDIKCPECQNTIELDWNTDESSGCCSGHCSTCSSKCGENNYFEDFLDDNDDSDDDDI